MDKIYRILGKRGRITIPYALRMYVGEYLTNSRLITEEEYQKLVAEQTKGLDKGYCLVTLEFPTSSAGVASVLRAGHIVDVHECIENEDESITVQKVLSSMYVYDVLNADLQSLSELDVKLEEAIVEEDTDYDFQPAFVVFRCTEEQAQTLIRLERMESLHLTLQRTGGYGEHGLWDANGKVEVLSKAIEEVANHPGNAPNSKRLE